jgi:hypothetical protein
MLPFSSAIPATGAWTFWPRYHSLHRPLARIDGEEVIFQILLHDRLAHRLAGIARRSGPARRAPGAEPVHQRTLNFPGRGRSGVRLPR